MALKKLTIDPGHGGRDPGAVRFIVEKEYCLKLGLALRDYLLSEYLVDIQMTRTRDVYVSLSERAAKANRFGAELFFSIHINAGGGAGYEDFIWSGAVGNQTVQFRSTIHREVARVWEKHGRPNRDTVVKNCRPSWNKERLTL